MDETVRGKKILRVIATVLIVCLLILFITLFCLRIPTRAVLEDYHNMLRQELNMIQIKLQEALSDGTKRNIPSLALDYERLGGTYADVSLTLFSSYLDTGEWGSIARILLGLTPSSNLFKATEITLSAEEIAFLEELFNYNLLLLKQISADETFRTIRSLSAEELQDILNEHQYELQIFLWGG